MLIDKYDYFPSILTLDITKNITEPFVKFKNLLHTRIVKEENFVDKAESLVNIIDAPSSALYLEGVYNPEIITFPALETKARKYREGYKRVESVKLSFSIGGQESYTFETDAKILAISTFGSFHKDKDSDVASVSFIKNAHSAVFKLMYVSKDSNDIISFNGVAQILLLEGY